MVTATNGTAGESAFIAGFSSLDDVHLAGYAADEVSNALANATVFGGSELLHWRDRTTLGFGGVTGLAQSSFVSSGAGPAGQPKVGYFGVIMTSGGAPLGERGGRPEAGGALWGVVSRAPAVPCSAGFGVAGLALAGLDVGPGVAWRPADPAPWATASAGAAASRPSDKTIRSMVDLPFVLQRASRAPVRTTPGRIACWTALANKRVAPVTWRAMWAMRPDLLRHGRGGIASRWRLLSAGVSASSQAPFTQPVWPAR